MSGYIGNIPVPQATQTRDVFTATSGQTTFATSGYTPGYLDVWLNGVKLVNGTDFTATNGSDVVLTSGAAAGDVLEVVAYSTYQVNSQNYTGGLTVDNDGATALTVDRASSDGAIIDVQKDGSTVGSIGTTASKLIIGSGATGVRFNYAGLDTIAPWNVSTNSLTDNATSLGYSNTRFKDLYLSGGVYLGGTGSANLLDDYETGTWTPTDASGAALSFTNTSGNCTYVKSGSLVIAGFRITFPSTVSATLLEIGGLPFTPISTSNSPIFGGLFSETSDTDNQTVGVRSSVASIIFITFGGSRRTNSQASGKDYRGMVIYRA